MCYSVPVYSVSSFMSYPCLALVDSILIPPLLLRFGHCHRYLLSQIYEYIRTILRIISINISFRPIFILFQVFPNVSSTFPGNFSGRIGGFQWNFVCSRANSEEEIRGFEDFGGDGGFGGLLQFTRGHVKYDSQDLLIHLRSSLHTAFLSP